MKKAMSVVLMAFVALVFVGCPATVQIPLPDVSVVSGDTSAVPANTAQPPIVQPDMGKVIVSGKLFDPKAKASIRDYGDLLKSCITSLDFYFSPAEGGECQSFFIPIVDGSYHAEMLVLPGKYNVYVDAVDYQGYILFTDYVEMKVSAGDNHLKVVLEMVQGYKNRFLVPDLPGEYGDSGNAFITTSDGTRYYVWYSMQYLGGGMGKSAAKGGGGESEPLRVFEAWLPLDFDGKESQAYMAVTDVNGKTYATEINFNLFQAVEGVMEVPYIYPSWLGDINVDISFEYENSTEPPVPVPVGK